MSSILEVRALCKTYTSGPNRVEVLNGIDLDLQAGTTTALVGASGAGKSTLMHLLGALDRPTSGTVLFRGEDVFKKNDRELAAFRNRSIGFVFQFHHLLPEFTALENVMMPALIARVPRNTAMKNAAILLNDVGLGQRMTHRPGELSGGEQQRVAIARALALEPEILLADEPTGNLDSSTGQQVIELIMALHRDAGTSLVLVTHDQHLAASMERVITLRDGRVASDRLASLHQRMPDLEP